PLIGTRPPRAWGRSPRNVAAGSPAPTSGRAMMMAVGRRGVHDGYGVFVGLDVGKEGHHAVALNREGKRLHDATLPNTEAGLRRLFDKLGRHGRILVVVDQPASIGALPVAVARACGH